MRTDRWQRTCRTLLGQNPILTLINEGKYTLILALGVLVLAASGIAEVLAVRDAVPDARCAAGEQRRDLPAQSFVRRLLLRAVRQVDHNISDALVGEKGVGDEEGRDGVLSLGEES